MLTIRPFTDQDRDTLESHLMIPSIAAALPEFHAHDFDVWLETILDDPHAYVITLDNNMIGACRLQKNPHSDFSYWIHPDHRGCGHATQINLKLCRIAISLGWKTIGGTCDKENKSSQAVLIRCGFKEIRPTYWFKHL